ncbi:hypothetical protein [Herbaspirillum huttiense]|nr:hypothetical protein [Herbaspirillum huttiense]
MSLPPGRSLLSIAVQTELTGVHCPCVTALPLVVEICAKEPG